MKREAERERESERQSERQREIQGLRQIETKRRTVIEGKRWRETDRD